MEPAGTGDGVESVRVERNHLARISTDAHVARVCARYYSFIFDLLVDYMYVLDVELRVRALGETTNDAFLDFPYMYRTFHIVSAFGHPQGTFRRSGMPMPGTSTKTKDGTAGSG